MGSDFRTPVSKAPIKVLRIGMLDYGTGIEPGSLNVTASIPIDGVPAGENLATRSKAVDAERWEWTLKTPLSDIEAAELRVPVRDKAGNVTEVTRSFSIR